MSLEKLVAVTQKNTSPQTSAAIISTWLRESTPPFNLRSSSVHPPFILRSTSVHPPFILRSTSVQPPFILRSTSVRAPFELRSSSVQAPFELRSFSVRRSKNDRRNIGESSEAKRRCNETLMGNQGKGNLNKKTPKIPHKPHAPDFQKKTSKKLSARKTLKINTLPKIAKKFFKKNFKKHLVIIEKRRTFALANQK